MDREEVMNKVGKSGNKWLKVDKNYYIYIDLCYLDDNFYRGIYMQA